MAKDMYAASDKKYETFDEFLKDNPWADLSDVYIEKSKKEFTPLSNWEEILNSHVGQEEFKVQARMHLKYCIEKKKSFPHTMLYGSTGLGKTELAHLLAKILGGNFKEHAGGSINKLVILEDIISNIREYDILFIDEIHSFKKDLGEVLYQVMDQFKYLGNQLPQFTVIGATTDAGLVTPPMMRRFPLDYEMEHYTIKELGMIVQKRLPSLSIEECIGVARRSFGNPGVVVKYAKHLEASRGVISTEDLFDKLGIDKIGLKKTHRRILEFLVEFEKPVGVQTIAYACDISQKDLIHIYEKQLMRLGFLIKTPRGRLISNRGREYVLMYGVS